MKGAGPNPCIFCSPLHQGYLVPWLVFIVLVLRAFTWWFTFSLDIAKIKRCLLFLTLRLSTMLSLMPHQSFSGYANYKRILVFIYLLWSCSVVQIFYNDVFHGKTKHIEIDFHLIRHHLHGKTCFSRNATTSFCLIWRSTCQHLHQISSTKPFQWSFIQ